MRSKSKNTPFDGWQLRGGVAATIVGGRTVYVNDDTNDLVCNVRLQTSRSDIDASEPSVDRREEIRAKALKDLQQSEVLMIDGHFDYGNGYHGRVYLNPHQLFRHPSTIWRFAQDLLDVLPGELVQRTEVVAGPVTGGALLAHTIAGLLDSRRSLTHPPCRLRPVQLRSGRRLHAARVLRTRARRQARAAGRRCAEHRRDVRALRGAGDGGRRHGRWRPSRSTIASKRSPTLGVPELSRSPNTRRPRTSRRRTCPLCSRGSADHAILRFEQRSRQALKDTKVSRRRPSRSSRLRDKLPLTRGVEPQVSDGAPLDLRALHPHPPVTARRSSRPGNRRSAARAGGPTDRRRRGTGCRWPARDRRSAGSPGASAARTGVGANTGPTLTVLQSPPFGTDAAEQPAEHGARCRGPGCGKTAGARRPSASASCRSPSCAVSRATPVVQRRQSPRRRTFPRAGVRTSSHQRVVGRGERAATESA